MVKKKVSKTKVSKNGFLDSAMSGDIKGLTGALGFMGSGKTMFSGMNLNVGIGQKAIVKGNQVSMKGHEPQAEFATLSDGSKLGLIGKNKGMRFE